MECGVVASRPLFQINSPLHVSVLKHNLEGSVLGAFHCSQVKTDRNFELLIVVSLKEKTIHEFFQSENLLDYRHCEINPTLHNTQSKCMMFSVTN